MSHTPSCERTGHVESEAPASPDGGPTGDGPTGDGPTGDGPVPGRPLGRRMRRTASFLALPEVRWAAASFVAFALAAAARGAGLPDALSATLFAVCYLSGGWEPALAGLRALGARSLDVDLLMVVAAVAAASIGQVFDGALLIVIFATSGALEAVATKRTVDSVRALLDLAPDSSTRITAGGTEQRVPSAELAVGDTMLVRPGERVGADGIVLTGASDVDQASITGEPLPVAKLPGSEVFAGTVNGTGALRVRVEREAGASVVARIVALVEQAAATKARTQLFIEKVEQRYSVGVVVATLALVAVPLAFGAAFEPTLLRAMTFMIVASPCAVVLATMPPLLSAIATAGRHGVLVKSAVVMEELGRTSRVAFDKTGTLTVGAPHVTDLRLLPGCGLDEAALLRLAAAAERPSEHPLGRAVVAAAAAHGLTPPRVDGFSSVPGRGVRAVVDGQLVEVGSPAAAGPTDGGRLGSIVGELQRTGRTAVVVRVDGDPVGVLGLADRLRPGAGDAVASLRRLTATSPVLLTGDNRAAAERLATEVGIDDVRAGLLPEDKVGVVRDWRAAGDHVTLVGDGINDSPALASADCGVAMGRVGADLALQTADAVLVRDDLSTLPAVVDLSRRARRVVQQNLVLAAVVVCALVLVDLVGHLPLPLGVAGHEGSTVVVALNGLRLLSSRHWEG